MQTKHGIESLRNEIPPKLGVSPEVPERLAFSTTHLATDNIVKN